MPFGITQTSHFIAITISLFLSSKAIAQDTLSLPLAGNINVMEVDAKGNFYVADDDFSLYKYDSRGNLITNVNIKTYGELSSIDCSNPFELYVYYQDQNILVFYDNMLNIRGELRLNDYYFNVACVARSFDNHIWLVDMTEYKMLKINKKGDVLIETPYLNNILNNEIYPFKIWEYNNKIYVADSLNGLYQFDIMGTYASTYYINGIDEITQDVGLLYYHSSDHLYAYRMMTREPIKLKRKRAKFNNLCYSQDSLFCSFRNKIISYPADL